MPKWATGNQVFFRGDRAWDSNESSTTQNVEFHLLRAASPTAEQLVWQPGFVRGVNIHAAQNTTTVDANVKFRHGVWNGGTGWVYDTDVILVTITAGQPGWFCMDPDAILDSDVDWRPRDKVSIRITKSAGGLLRHITLFLTLQISEEYLFTNDWDGITIFNNIPLN
jgi:hypothetical protein